MSARKPHTAVAASQITHIAVPYWQDSSSNIPQNVVGNFSFGPIHIHIHTYIYIHMYIYAYILSRLGPVLPSPGAYCMDTQQKLALLETAWCDGKHAYAFMYVYILRQGSHFNGFVSVLLFSRGNDMSVGVVASQR